MEKKLKNNEALVDNIDETAVPKKKKVANIIVNTILVIAIIVAAVCTYISYVSTSGSGVPSIFGIRMFSIQTESMYPTLEPGDLIFDKAVDVNDLKINDIITYWTVIDGERVLNTHRITEIYDGGGYLIFETKGDKNTAADALTVHESEVVGLYTGKRLEGVGKVFDYLQTSTGFLIVVVVPVAIFFLFHLIQFFRVLFEYNNIKNKLMYEMERGKTEDMLEDEKNRQADIRKKEREKLEAELREKLKAELLDGGAEEKKEAPVEKTPEEIEAEQRAELEAKIRAEMEAEAKAKAEAEAKAKAEEEARAKMEAEIREKIKAEMEAEAKAKAEAEASEETEA